MDTHTGMKIFTAVVEAEGFSAAARELGATPSSISRQIGELEDALGVRLLNRTTRRISLTEAGQVYYDRAKGILRNIDEANQAVAQLNGEPRGLLRLTSSNSFARRHILPHLPSFMARHPNVRIELSLTDEMVDIVEGGFDLGIRIGELKPSSLIARRLVGSPVVVYGSVEYLNRAGIPETPEDLAHHNCLVHTRHPKGDRWRFHGPDGMVEVKVSGDLRSNDGEALHEAVQNGLGLGRFPIWLSGPALEAGIIRAVLTGFRAEPSNLAVHVVYPPNRHLAPKVRSFVDFLVERFGEQRFWELGAPPPTTGAAPVRKSM